MRPRTVSSVRTVGFKDDHDLVSTLNIRNQHISPEVLASAAAFEATKMYHEHEARHGKPGSLARAKEIFTGAADQVVSRLAQAKGLDTHKVDEAKKAVQILLTTDGAVQIDLNF